MERNHCEELFAVETELKNFRRDCAQGNPDNDSLSQQVFGCGSGGARATIDSIRGFVEWLAANENVGSQFRHSQLIARDNRDAIFDRCAQDDDCMRSLIQSIASTRWHRQYFDDDKKMLAELDTVTDPKNPKLLKMMMFNQGFVMNHYRAPTALKTLKTTRRSGR